MPRVTVANECQVELDAQTCWDTHPWLSQYEVVRTLASGFGGPVVLIRRKRRSRKTDGHTSTSTDFPREAALKLIFIGKPSWDYLERTRCTSFWFKVPLVGALVKNWLSRKFEREPHQTPVTLEGFRRDVALARKAGELGVGPRVLFSGLCTQGVQTLYGKALLGLHVTEKLDATLWGLSQKLVIKHTTDICSQLMSLAKVADENGLYHTDVHGGNIMLKLPSRSGGDSLRVYLIDWDMSEDTTNRSWMLKYLKGEDPLPVTQLDAWQTCYYLWIQSRIAMAAQPRASRRVKHRIAQDMRRLLASRTLPT